MKSAIIYCMALCIVGGILAMAPSGNSENIHHVRDIKNKKLPSQPNIIVIMADDFGYELPAYTGGESYNTPNLDFMAANGIQFTNAYSHPDGYPSRLAFQTGKYNVRNYTIWGTLPAGEKTIGNMLHDAGYTTCFVGKWNMDGGDATIHSAGYDNYLVFMPFAGNDNDAEFRHQYIDPHLYENGDFLPEGQITGKYSENMYFDYLSAFIDKNPNRPFFAFYAANLPRNPFTPSPDDPLYPGFDPDTAVVNDPKYFPGMVEYLDKTVGKILAKLEANGLAENTVIIFCADNATTKLIRSEFNGRTVNGGKNLTTRAGTRTPLEVYWPGTITPGLISNTLIDYTDMLPTLADIAGIPTPSGYGPLDGTSFYDNLLTMPGPDRSWVYCYWDNSPDDTKNPIRFVTDATYKLYKDTFGIKRFYRLQDDITEQNPVPDNELTPGETSIKQTFESIIDQYGN